MAKSVSPLPRLPLLFYDPLSLPPPHFPLFLWHLFETVRFLDTAEPMVRTTTNRSRESSA